MLLVASTGTLTVCLLPAGGGPPGATAARSMQDECRSIERRVSVCFAASNRRAARSRSSPVSNARAGYASRAIAAPAMLRTISSSAMTSPASSTSP